MKHHLGRLTAFAVPFTLPLTSMAQEPESVRIPQGQHPVPAAAPVRPKQPVTVKVGDVAPPYAPLEWIQGEPVRQFEPGKVYLIEFTASWCGPCLMQIPHLNELHNKFKDRGLVVIGQHVIEHNPEDVAPFVKKMAAKLTYRIASDNKPGARREGLVSSWMYASGHEGIPTAFLINQQGRIAWIGHPVELKEELIEQVISGNFDLAKATADYAKVAENLFQVVKDEDAQRPAKQKPVPKLKLGSAAPKLQVGKWIQGEPVKEFEADKAYLVEFWATWCGPCRATIPHLTALHEKYKDRGLVVIGQSFEEKDQNLVAPYVAKMGESMTYRVALDDMSGGKLGRMDETWIKAAGINAIPTAFLVDKTGHIAWIGHPQRLPEATIEQVLAGNFEVGRELADGKKRIEDLRRKLKESKDLLAEIRKQVAAKEWEKAEMLVDQLAEGRKTSFTYLRFHIAKRDFAAVAGVASKLSDENPNKYSYQYTLLRELAYLADPPAELVDLGLKIGQRALDTQTAKTPNVYDALARLKFLKGDQAGAVEMGEQAKKLANRENIAERYQQAIDLYRQGKLPEGELKVQLRGLYSGFESSTSGDE